MGDDEFADADDDHGSSASVVHGLLVAVDGGNCVPCILIIQCSLPKAVIRQLPVHRATNREKAARHPSNVNARRADSCHMALEPERMDIDGTLDWC